MILRTDKEKWEIENLDEKAKKSKNASRWKPEKKDKYRTAYEKDKEKIIFSDPFRRLRMKTQIYTARGVNQHSRTRLTHTLEVAHTAEIIARSLNVNTDLAEAIAYAHDLGHTPFGHAGESALNEILKSKDKKFSHNIQSVWLLRRYNMNSRDKYNNYVKGFNLTHDVVKGVLKHTDYENNLDEIDHLEDYNLDEADSIESQIVKIADSLSYRRHDLEDGIKHWKTNFGTKEAEELFNDLSDKYSVEIDLNNWYHYLIDDLIKNSANKKMISFSKSGQKIYDEIYKTILKKIIKSETVDKGDTIGKEIIKTIYDHYDNNFNILLERNEYNKIKLENTNKERVIIDYIQWLGDENAINEYKDIKPQNKFF